MAIDELLKELEKGGFLEEEQVAKLKRESFLSGHSLEDLLHEKGLVDDVKIAETKSALLKIPFQRLNLEKYDEKLLEVIPEETARTYGVVPISREENLFVIGMLHPDDLKAQEAVKFIARRHRLTLGVYIISYSDWQKVLEKYSPFRSQIEAAIQALHLREGEGKRKVVELEASVGSKDDAPIIRIVADTLKEAVQSRASDVHIEPQETYLRVRFRIDGDLHEVASLPIEIALPVISRVKIISSLKIDESRIPQDGRFRSRILDREIDFRVSTFPTPLGEKVAIRILDPTTGLKKLSDLGLIERNEKLLKSGLEKPFGMILVTGPTGSGKSTALYAMLQFLNREDINIVSLEDPVEYFVSGLNQSQVRPEIGYDFASGLRQILRQDPDVIMVGEIRDSETAGLAVHAALTGHIVLSTLHTNNTLGVVPRLMDMGVEPFLLPSSLNLMTAQRLISRLCLDCRVAGEAPPQVQEIIRKTLQGVPAELHKDYGKPYKIFHAQGCPKCRNRGIVGRIALFEILEMTKELKEIVTGGASASKMLEEAKRQGMITLRDDGILKALKGLVPIEEVLRETEEM